jgi:formate dehydrogenase major subunit
LITRRHFLRASGAGLGFTGLVGLGLDPGPLAAQTRRRLAWKIEGTHAAPSVCPYCAVGCGQLVHSRDGKIVNIEGNPDSPISQGTLCPKGAATYQLAVNPERITKPLYRAPGSDRWEEKPLDWMMDRIAERFKKTRDQSFRATWDGKTVNHTMGIASLGGATLDNEWNYVQTKLLRSCGAVFIENQARI